MSADPSVPSSTGPASNPTNAPATHNGLRISAALVAVLTVIQAAMGSLLLSGMDGIRTVHGYIGYATLAAAILAAVMGAMAVKTTGSKGTMWHAISLPILAVIQIGLAEMDQPVLHAMIGFATLIAAIALWAMAGPKPQQVERDPSKPRL